MIRPTRNMILKKKSQSVGLTMESVVTKRRGWTALEHVGDTR